MISVKVWFFMVFGVFVYVLVNMNHLSRIQRKMMPSLYTVNTTLRTTTKSYEVRDGEYSGHKFGLGVRQESGFGIDDSNQVYLVANLTCKPDSFGYSVEDGKRVFKDYTYPNCSDIVEGELPKMSFDYEQNLFMMSCESGTPYYVLEPTKHKGRLYQYAEISPLFKLEKYKKPVKLTTEDFAMGGCDHSQLNNALHIPRYNETAHKKTKQKMLELNQLHKPQITLLLTIDSYSRRHFYRKLPKTVRFLDKLKESFGVFDFKIHNIFGDNSVENMVPVFTDQYFKEKKEIRDYDALGDDSMWKFFRSKGFITLFGLEDCDFYFPNTIGRYPEVDHVVRSFYCAAKEYMNLNTMKTSGNQQRCIGPEMSHWYILNYTMAFSSMYSDINQWIYLHINTAHEATGQHAATLDNDLVEFLHKYIEKFRHSHDLAIFLQADHGMRYGNWFQEIEGYQENKLPVFFLLISNELLDRIPMSNRVLQNNTLRLTTKKDLRPSVNFLADLPYGPGSKNVNPVYVNIFQDSAPLNRTCEYLKISPFQCSCLVIKEIFNVEDNKELYKLILRIIDEAILYMNKQVNTPAHGNFGLCHRLTFHKILNTYGLVLNNKVEELQIKFNVNENSNATFEVFAFVGTEFRNTMLKIDGDRGTISNYVYRGFKAKIKLVGVKRKDKYAGKCEDLTRSLYIKSEYCLCKSDRLEVLI